jgi:putative Holliday junction resolvase
MPEAPGSTRALLAFDFGLARLGVAVGYIETGLTHPLVTLRVKNEQPDWQQIERLIKEWNPARLIVGLPLNMDGSDNEMTSKARKFGNRLNGRYNLPVHMVDERLTTRIATEALAESDLGYGKHRAAIDQLAAQQILQTYLTDLNQGDNKGALLEPGH